MTGNIWVARHDGTIQCEPDIPEETLEEAREDLEQVIGAKNVLQGQKRFRTVPFGCGLKTGNYNAFEITPEGWQLLQDGTPGDLGFELWPEGESFTVSKGKDDLVGCTLRVYHTGDQLSKDYIKDRANIELGKDERIVRVWIG